MLLVWIEKIEIGFRKWLAFVTFRHCEVTQEVQESSIVIRRPNRIWGWEALWHHNTKSCEQHVECITTLIHAKLVYIYVYLGEKGETNSYVDWPRCYRHFNAMLQTSTQINTSEFQNLNCTSWDCNQQNTLAIYKGFRLMNTQQTDNCPCCLPTASTRSWLTLMMPQHLW